MTAPEEEVVDEPAERPLKYWQSREKIRKASERMKAQWAQPGYRERVRAAMRAAQQRKKAGS